ncbi:MAG TPA: sugar phosphate nucleotidyltransferase [Thermoanaerobaculia bacterium]
MKVIILCGGTGSRLVGAELPKPMVPIAGRPILWHIMRGFSHWGFRDFVLCLGYRSDLFKHYFLNLPVMLSDVTLELGGEQPVTIHGRSDEAGWRITLAETGHDSMTGCRVRRAAPDIPEGDDCFAVTYGDGVTDVDFRQVVAHHRASGKLATVTAVHPPGRFGELQFDAHGSVVEFNEKPQTSAGWISGGFFVFSRAFLDRLPDDPGLVLEGEPLRALARLGELSAYRHDGFWFCMDTPRDHRQLTEMASAPRPPWAVWERGEERT